jgi:hypothetical protein
VILPSLLHDQPVALLRAQIERPHCGGFCGFAVSRFYLTEHLQLVAD